MIYGIGSVDEDVGDDQSTCLEKRCDKAIHERVIESVVWRWDGVQLLKELPVAPEMMGEV